MTDTYHISWSIEFDSDPDLDDHPGPIAAALWARGVQLDPDSVATVFTVTNTRTGKVYMVDVEDTENPIILKD